MSAATGFLSNLMLAVFWSLASGRITAGTLVVGFIAGFATLFVTRRATGATAYTKKAGQTAALVLVFLRELVEGAARTIARLGGCIAPPAAGAGTGDERRC